MVDNGKSASTEIEIFNRRLRATQTEYRPRTECLFSSVYQAFPVFNFLYHCLETGIFFSTIFAPLQKSYCIDFKSFNRIISYRSK